MAVNDPYAAEPGVAAEQPAPDPQPAPEPSAAGGQDNSALQQQIADLKNQVAALQQENQNLQNQNSQLQTQLQQAQGEVEAANNQIDQLNSTLEQEKADHQADAAEAQRIIDDLNSKVSDSAENPADSAQLTTLQAENQRLTDLVAQLQSGQGAAPTGFTAPPPTDASQPATPVMAGGVPNVGLGPKVGGFALPTGVANAAVSGLGGFDNVASAFGAPPDKNTIDGQDTGNGSASQIYGPDNMPTPESTVPAAAVAAVVANPNADTQTVTLPSGAVVIHYRGPNGEDMMFSRDNLSVADANAATAAWTASVNADVAQRNQQLAEDKEKYRREVEVPQQQQNFNRTTEATLEAARMAARGREAPKGLTLEQGQAQRNAELTAPTFGNRAAQPLSGPQPYVLDPNRIHEENVAAQREAQRQAMELQKQETINQTQLAIAAMNKKSGFRSPSFGRFRR